MFSPRMPTSARRRARRCRRGAARPRARGRAPGAAVKARMPSHHAAAASSRASPNATPTSCTDSGRPAPHPAGARRPACRRRSTARRSRDRRSTRARLGRTVGGGGEERVEAGRERRHLLTETPPVHLRGGQLEGADLPAEIHRLADLRRIGVGEGREVRRVVRRGLRTHHGVARLVDLGERGGQVHVDHLRPRGREPPRDPVQVRGHLRRRALEEGASTPRRGAGGSPRAAR